MIFDGLNAAIIARLAGGLIGSADGVTRPEPIAGPWADGSFDWSAVGGVQLLPGPDGTRVTGGDGSTTPGVAAPERLPAADAVPWPAPHDVVDLPEAAAQLLPAFDGWAGYEPPFSPAFSHQALGGDFFAVLSHA